jgi:hypothetical protein
MKSSGLSARRSLVGGVLLSVVFTVSACSDNSPTTPAAAPLSLTGNWATTITFADISARMTWQLTQTGTNVSGPVLVSVPSGTVLLNGFLNGTLNGSSLDYTITVAPGGIPNQTGCGGQLKGTMTATQTTLAGSLGVASSNCTVPLATNTISMTKSS